jgi:hypothetical protein
MFLFAFTGNLIAQVNVILPSISRYINDSEEYISINVDDLTDKNVKSFEFTLFYNSEIIIIKAASKNNIQLTENGLLAYNADTLNGKIKVGWISIDAIKGGGELIKLLVRFKAYGSSILTFVDPQTGDTSFKFNTGNPSAIVHDGNIEVIDPTALSESESCQVISSYYKLLKNYPNPFNPSTVINYWLPVGGNVSLKVYNPLGREVAELVKEYQIAGEYNVKFNADDFRISSGVYICKLSVGSFGIAGGKIYIHKIIYQQ